MKKRVLLLVLVLTILLSFSCVAQAVPSRKSDRDYLAESALYYELERLFKYNDEDIIDYLDSYVFVSSIEGSSYAIVNLRLTAPYYTGLNSTINDYLITLWVLFDNAMMEYREIPLTIFLGYGNEKYYMIDEDMIFDFFTEQYIYVEDYLTDKWGDRK